jgi:hypothetical protein
MRAGIDDWQDSDVAQVAYPLLRAMLYWIFRDLCVWAYTFYMEVVIYVFQCCNFSLCVGFKLICGFYVV